MIKYASNGFLAMKIGYANEMANICERVGADVTDVMAAVGLDSRIGPKFLNAGWVGAAVALGRTFERLSTLPASTATARSCYRRLSRSTLTSVKWSFESFRRNCTYCGAGPSVS